jgi:homoserine kinase
VGVDQHCSLERRQLGPVAWGLGSSAQAWIGGAWMEVVTMVHGEVGKKKL